MTQAADLTVIILAAKNANTLRRAVLDVELSSLEGIQKRIVRIGSDDFEVRQVTSGTEFTDPVSVAVDLCDLSRVLNQLIRGLETRYISFLFAEDVPARRYYETAIRMLENTGAAAVFPKLSFQGDRLIPVARSNSPEPIVQLSETPYCGVLDRETLFDIGGLSEGLPFGVALWELWDCLQRRKQAVFVELEDTYFYIDQDVKTLWSPPDPLAGARASGFGEIAVRNPAFFELLLRHLVKQKNDYATLAGALQGSVHHLESFLGLRIHRWLSQFPTVYRPIVGVVRYLALFARSVIILIRALRQRNSRSDEPFVRGLDQR